VGNTSLFRCAQCGTWSSLPRVDTSHQAALHDSAEYFDHEYFKARRQITPHLEQRCRQVFARLAVGIDTASLRGQRLLDVGCDTGTFLECAAQQFGILPVGLDVASRSVSTCLSAGIEAYHATIETAPENLASLRAITAIDVVEHVADPAGFLCALRARLALGGVVYLETPNIRSSVYRLGRVLSRVLGGRPRGVFERLFPPQHIQYFTIESFERLARDAGFEVVRTGTRVLPWADIGTSLLVRAAVSSLELVDRLTGNEILIWAVLRQPASANR
jgi:2-polyprenyl-3-methyl-5-hydroxy-6-metoxy-1,4-benzoquinol methylase